MCYDVKATPKAQMKRAKDKGGLFAVEEIEETLLPLTDLPLHHSSGFSHPEMFIYTDVSPHYPTVATWGLIPHWVKDTTQQKKFWNNTLNARGESIFEKPSFRDAAKNKRCLIYIDGFYEHHHYNNKTYPFYIQHKDSSPIALAGLWSEWTNPENGGTICSFSIVTTKGNSLMAKIHNNPKIKEPRMPLILPDALTEEWLQPINDNLDQKKIQELILSYPENELKAHTVGKLRGKEYAGNIETISNEVTYDDLKF